jgi:glycosyltransferase involved in cell wall biosynthesis
MSVCSPGRGIKTLRGSRQSVPQPVTICYIIDRLDHAGTESQLLALIQSIDQRSVRPLLVVLDGSDVVSRDLEPQNCPVLRLGVRKLGSVAALRAARQFIQFLRSHKVDLLQAYFLDSAYFSIPLARLAGIKRVVRVRNNLGYWLTPKHRYLNRILSPWVNVTITNSQAGKEALQVGENIPEHRIQILENGVDLERFSAVQRTPPFAHDGPPRIGCVANLRPVKNIDGLIHATLSLRNQFPALTVHVAGDGPQRSELEQLIVRSGLQSTVRLLGRVTNIPEFLQSVDIVVLPSHSEGMSNALLEAMAAARAIVATNVGANPRLIRNGIDGRIVTPEPESIARGIAELCAHPDEARRYALSARQRVQTEYSREAMCRRFVEFYRRIMSNTGSHAVTENPEFEQLALTSASCLMTGSIQ